MKKLMIKLKGYWKGVAPAAAVISITVNALGPQNPWWYVVSGVLGLAGVLFGPKNATPEEIEAQMAILAGEVKTALPSPLPEVPKAPGGP